jgi:hypothetical protein
MVTEKQEGQNNNININTNVILTLLELLMAAKKTMQQMNFFLAGWCAQLRSMQILRLGLLGC